MRRKYQSGGLADLDLDDENIPASLRSIGEELEAGAAPEGGPTGALDPTTAVMMAMTEAFGRTTTPEAQGMARQILNKYMTPDESARESILGGKRTQAEQVRQALRTARERLLAQPTLSRSELLLSIGRGLGSPTRTGAIGETAGNVAREAADPIRRQREFILGRDEALSQLDLADAQSDEGLINAEFELNKLREEIEGRLAVEALDTLGKTTRSGQTWRGPVPAAVQALDTRYAQEYYLPFKAAGGNERMAAGLNRLRFVKDVLENGSDALTGRYVGAVANLPGVGRWLQAAVLPKSADLRDIVERTIQEDLRPTLGSQFTEREGENLINRSYNTSLEEKQNARRIGQLIEQMEQVYKNQTGMAEYFENNQTLFGYQSPKLAYSADSFKFEDEGVPGTVIQFRDMPPGPEKDLQFQLWLEQHPGEEPPEWMLRSLEGRAKGGRVRYQEGGRVRFDPPDEQSNAVGFAPPEESSMLDELQLAWEDYNDPVGTTLGGVGGLMTNAALDTLAERALGGRERRVADAITSGGLDPIAVAQDIKRNRRAGVPETLMDVDTAGVRALTEEAFKYGDAPAEVALRDLRNRLEGSRERVNERVNTGLKPYQYFEYDNKLVRNLEGPRSEEMKKTFSAYPTIPQDAILSDILATPEGQSAVDWAFRFYENDPRRGKINREEMLANPSLEFFDFVRKGFNQTIAQEEGKGDTEFGKVLRDLREMYLNRIDQIAPEYQAAREAQGDDLRIRDALHAGRGFMRKQPEELAGIAQQLSFHEINAFRTGMAQHLYEVLDRATSENFNAAQRIVGSPAMMERLEPFFDSAQEFKLFQTALERESELMRIGKQRLREGESGRMFREKNRQNLWEYASQRLPGLRFAISLPGWTLRLLRDRPKMTPKEAEQVLGILRRGRPEEMNAFMRKVQKLKTLRKTRWGRRGAAAAIGAGAAAIMGADDEE